MGEELMQFLQDYSEFVSFNNYKKITFLSLMPVPSLGSAGST
jgi:hypothetical protein